MSDRKFSHFRAWSQSHPNHVLCLSLSANFLEPHVLTSYEANDVAVILPAASNLHVSSDYEEQVVKFG